MTINKTTQYTTDPNTIPVDTSIGTQELSVAFDSRVTYVNTLSDLKSLPTSGLGDGQAARISTTGRAGDFTWDSSDLSTEVAGDPEEAVFVAPSGQNGSTGAWKRVGADSSVRALWFGLLLDGTDEATLLTAVRDYMSANPDKALVLDAGRYTYSTSPNWAIQDLKVVCDGEVTFVNTGTGNCLIFDDPTGTTFNIKWCWGDKFYVEGDENTGHGVYWRSCHHSKISANVRGCGSNFLRTEFAVVNEFDVVCSVNQGAFTSTPAPAGMSLSQRGAGEETSANTFINPIVEGMRGIGIFLDQAIANSFLGGTSEGNAGANIECSINSRKNTFYGIDLEATGSGQGFIDRGRFNTFLEIFNDAASTITSSAVNCTVRGGILDSVSNAGKATVLEDFSYSANGGSVSDTGTETTIKDIYNLTSAAYTLVNKDRGRVRTSFDVTTGAWATPSTVPGAVTKNIGSISAPLQIGDIVTVAPKTSYTGNYIITAKVLDANSIEIRINQITGTAASPFPSGTDFNCHVEGQ